MDNTSHRDIITILKEQFPELEAHLTVVKYVGDIHVFFLKTPSHDFLKLNWEAINSVLAFYYQVGLKTDFEIWNIYLLFIVPGLEEKHIKYQIENDTTSSRKIVIQFNGVINGDFMNAQIAAHITNTDLNLVSTEPRVKQHAFTKNMLIWDAVNKCSVGKDKPLKSTEEINTILEILEKKYSDEV